MSKQFSTATIPDALLSAARNGELAVFAGAGVSRQDPLELPLFDDLADEVRNRVDLLCQYDRRETEPPEKHLTRLHDAGFNVHKVIAEVVDEQVTAKGPTTSLHEGIAALFPDGSTLRIVTTNFDPCFENTRAFGSRNVRIYENPALPRGDDFCGLVYLHGTTRDPENIIVTGDDFGTAYITKGWASEFLKDMFSRYTVLFVGYSCDDALVNYITRSLSGETAGRIFALVRECDTSSEWRNLNVEVVEYECHENLPAIFGEWAADTNISTAERIHHLREIAGKGSDTSSEDIAYFRDAISYPDDGLAAAFARAFCDRASDPFLLQALHADVIDALEKPERSSAENVLVTWALTKLPLGEREDVTRLYHTRIAAIDPALIAEQGRFIVNDGYPDARVAEWLLLIDRATALSCPAHPLIPFYLSQIVTHTGSRELFQEALRILLSVSYDPNGSCKGSVRMALLHPPFEPCRKRIADALSDNWPNLYGDALDLCVRHIGRAYDIESGFGTDSTSTDWLSYNRKLINPDEGPDYYGHPIGLLIDIAAHAALCLASDDGRCIEVASRLLSSSRELVARIGAFVLSEKCEDPHAMTKLIREYDILRISTNMKEEAIDAIVNAYGKCGETDREQLLGYVSDALPPDAFPHTRPRVYGLLGEQDPLAPAKDELETAAGAKRAQSSGVARTPPTRPEARESEDQAPLTKIARQIPCPVDEWPESKAILEEALRKPRGFFGEHGHDASHMAEVYLESGLRYEDDQQLAKMFTLACSAHDTREFAFCKLGQLLQADNGESAQHVWDAWASVVLAYVYDHSKESRGDIAKLTRRILNYCPSLRGRCIAFAQGKPLPKVDDVMGTPSAIESIAADQDLSIGERLDAIKLLVSTQEHFAYRDALSETLESMDLPHNLPESIEPLADFCAIHGAYDLAESFLKQIETLKDGAGFPKG